MFFKLLPEVYLIVGKKKSLLQNVSNGRIFWIDNTFGDGKGGTYFGATGCGKF